jgi:hypothetical protein
MHDDSGIQIQEILSRCLVDPPFLETLATDPDRALAPYLLSAQLLSELRKLDLRRIKTFSGFIGKVQHNHLWDTLPATLILLKRYGIELDLFGLFRPIQFSTRAQSRADQLGRFVAFVLDYSRAKPQFAALACVVRYEYLASGLKSRAGDSNVTPERLTVTPADLSWPAFQRHIPVLSGVHNLGWFGCDPGQLVNCILDGTFTEYVGGNSRLFLLKAAADGGGIRCFETDELTALMLSLIDGRRTVRAVITAARARITAAAKPRTFRDFFEQAVNAGLISISLGASK